MQPSHVPLSQLSIDDKVNVRKTGRGSEPMYVGSIRAKGIISPLIVRVNDKGYKIVDGGKRYDSLVWMKDHDEKAGPAQVPVTNDFPVPVTIRDEDDREAKDTSLMTNIVRAGMHPVDEFEAFAELRDGKMSEEEIAARYGLKVKEVKQRLALGRLSPTIRGAWREGRITAEQAMAYTIAPSHKAQDQFFKRHGTARYQGDAPRIREAFRGKQQDLGKMVTFVGVEAVRAAGVKVDEDLFGTDHRAADPGKVAALARAKLEAECQKLISAGWAWAYPEDDPLAGRINGSLGHHSREYTSEEKKRRDVLDDLIEEAPFMDYEDLTAEQRAAADEIDLIDREAEGRAYSAAEKKKSGCIVGISDSGFMTIDYGRLLPGEEKKIKAEAKAKERKKKGLAPKPAYDISKAVTHDLTATLTKAAAKAIVAEPDLALKLAVAGLLSCGYGGATVLLKNDGFLSRAILRDMEFDEALASVEKMTPAQRMTALAEQVGAAFHFNGDEIDDDKSGASIVCNMIDPTAMTGALGEAFDAADYFNRVPAGHVVKAIEEAVNPDEARRVAKLKKAQVVAFAVDNVIGTGWLPPELRTSHYDGPGAKAKAKEKPAAKKAGKGKKK